MEEVLLEVCGLTKHLGEFILKDISFSINKGFIMGVVGENGAGKTSVINYITGRYRSNIGEIKLLGVDFYENEKFVKDNIGLVTYEAPFLEYLTVNNNAKLVGKYYSRFDYDYFKEMCRNYDLSDSKEYRLLSNEEKIKFQLAFAFSHKPRLLILDEPTIGMSQEFREEFLRTLSRFIEDGERSVMYVTHLTKDLDKIADYITYIQNGKILFSMDKETMNSEYKIVTGKRECIDTIKREFVVGMREKEYGTTVLIRNNASLKLDKSLNVRPAQVEEIMYYMNRKGGC